MRQKRILFIFIVIILGLNLNIQAQKKKKKDPIERFSGFVLKTKIVDAAAKRAGIDTDSKGWQQAKSMTNGAMGTGDFDKELDKFRKDLDKEYGTNIYYKSNKYEKINGEPLWRIQKTVKTIIRENRWSYSFFDKYYTPGIENKTGYRGGKYLLHLAVEHGERSIARIIINRGFPINKRCWKGRRNRSKGKTVVEIAAGSKKGAHLIPFLIRNGASLYKTNALKIAIDRNNIVAINNLWSYTYSSEKAKALKSAYYKGKADVINHLTQKLRAPHYRKYQRYYIRGCVKNLREDGMKSILYKNIDNKIFNPADVLIEAYKSSEANLIYELNKMNISLNMYQIKELLSYSSINHENIEILIQVLRKSFANLSEGEKKFLGTIITNKRNYELLYLVKTDLGEKYIKDKEIVSKLRFYPIIKFLYTDRSEACYFLESLAKKSIFLFILFILLPIILYWIIVRRKIWAKILISIAYIIVTNVLVRLFVGEVLKDEFRIEKFYLTITSTYVGILWLTIVLLLKFRKLRKRKKLK